MRESKFFPWAMAVSVLFLALASVGCAGTDKNNSITITEPVVENGKFVPGPDGQPLTRTRTFSSEISYYEQQADNKPIFEMKAPEGTPITLPAGTHLVVRVPVTVRQYVPENVQLVREAKDLVPWLFGGFLAHQQGETARAGMSAAKGNKTTITTKGDGSPVSAPGGNAGSTTGTNVPTTTTTTTTEGAK